VASDVLSKIHPSNISQVFFYPAFALARAKGFLDSGGRTTDYSGR
jgi:hypothetical protein